MYRTELAILQLQVDNGHFINIYYLEIRDLSEVKIKSFLPCMVDVCQMCFWTGFGNRILAINYTSRMALQG